MSEAEKFARRLQECAHNREPITLFGVDYAPMDDVGLLETIIADIDEENAKLRELVDYTKPIAWYAASERERDRMRELGIEVDG